jgi:hypothetical protein
VIFPHDLPSWVKKHHFFQLVFRQFGVQGGIIGFNWLKDTYLPVFTIKHHLATDRAQQGVAEHIRSEHQGAYYSGRGSGRHPIPHGPILNR